MSNRETELHQVKIRLVNLLKDSVSLIDEIHSAEKKISDSRISFGANYSEMLSLFNKYPIMEDAFSDHPHFYEIQSFARKTEFK